MAGNTDARKQMKVLLERLAEAGCVAEASGGGHVKVRRSGKTLVVAATPSDHRSVLNAYADARRVLGVPVYMRTPPKKRKDSADDFRMNSIRKRVDKEMRRGVSFADLARLAIAVPRERGNPTWKSHNAAVEGIRMVMHDTTRRLTKVRYDALAAALNKIEHADDKALQKHLEWAAEYLGQKRLPHAPSREAEAAPVLRIAPEAPPAPASPERETEAEADAQTVRVVVELGPGTLSVLRELLRGIR